MFNKDDFQKLLDLKDAVVIEQLSGFLKPYARLIYIIGAVVYALAALSCLAWLITGAISAAIIGLVLVFAQFVILRMFCEFLMTCQK